MTKILGVVQKFLFQFQSISPKHLPCNNLANREVCFLKYRQRTAFSCSSKFTREGEYQRRPGSFPKERLSAVIERFQDRGCARYANYIGPRGNLNGTPITKHLNGLLRCIIAKSGLPVISSATTERHFSRI